MEDSAAKTPTRRVLLLDDDARFLKAANLYLSQKMDVTSATSGAAALELLDREEFQVVVSDMFMPNMRGTEFIRLARGIAPKTIYMLLTASRDNKTAIEAFNEAGVFCVINKPCSLKDLVGFVEAAFTEYEKNHSR